MPRSCSCRWALPPAGAASCSLKIGRGALVHLEQRFALRRVCMRLASAHLLGQRHAELLREHA